MVVDSNWRPIGASVCWGCDVFLSEELVAFRTPSTWTSMASHERCDWDAKCNTALLHPNFCQFEESILLMQLLGFGYLPEGWINKARAGTYGAKQYKHFEVCDEPAIGSLELWPTPLEIFVCLQVHPNTEEQDSKGNCWWFSMSSWMYFEKT